MTSGSVPKTAICSLALAVDAPRHSEPAEVFLQAALMFPLPSSELVFPEKFNGMVGPGIPVPPSHS